MTARRSQIDSRLRVGANGGSIVSDEPFSNKHPDGANDLKHYGGFLIAESATAENSRRLIACWNACIGSSTEDLERFAETVQLRVACQHALDWIKLAEAEGVLALNVNLTQELQAALDSAPQPSILDNV